MSLDRFFTDISLSIESQGHNSFMDDHTQIWIIQSQHEFIDISKIANENKTSFQV